MCTTPGAGAEERKQPAPEQLPCLRWRLWKQWQRVQGSRPGQGTTPKQACLMENVKELVWCDARDEQGHLQHAPDCEQRDCLVVQGKQQETNTVARAKLPDHYRCTITCAFCGKRKHYEDECYHKQCLSAKLKGDDPGKGYGKGGSKGKGNDSGKGKSKGCGQGQDKSQGGRGGGANRQPDKDNKDTDKNRGNPHTQHTQQSITHTPTEHNLLLQHQISSSSPKTSTKTSPHPPQRNQTMAHRQPHL